MGIARTGGQRTGRMHGDSAAAAGRTSLASRLNGNVAYSANRRKMFHNNCLTRAQAIGWRPRVGLIGAINKRLIPFE